MLRYVIGFSFAALALWILWATGAIMAVLIFLMIGVVPGTAITFSPSTMLGILAFCVMGMTYYIFRLGVAQRKIDTAKKPKKTRVSRRPRALPLLTRIANRLSYLIVTLGTGLIVAIKPLTTIATLVTTIILHTTSIAAVEIMQWLRPIAAKAAAWVGKQVRYSLKGTMLSAHRWSSLSKKLFSSGALLLKRCSSVLKRGKSFFIRATR